MIVSNNTLGTNRTTIIPYHLKRRIVVQNEVDWNAPNIIWYENTIDLNYIYTHEMSSNNDEIYHRSDEWSERWTK